MANMGWKLAIRACLKIGISIKLLIHLLFSWIHFKGKVAGFFVEVHTWSPGGVQSASLRPPQVLKKGAHRPPLFLCIYLMMNFQVRVSRISQNERRSLNMELHWGMFHWVPGYTKLCMVSINMVEHSFCVMSNR